MVGRLAIVALIFGACVVPTAGDMAIERIDPPSGLNDADVTVQIEGTGFALPITSHLDDGTTDVGSVAIALDSTPLASVTWRDQGLVEALIPAGLTPGFYDVTVTLGDRTATRQDGYEVTVVAPLGPFTTPVPVGTTPGVDDPSLTDDRLELYFNAGSDVFVATRGSVTDAWGTPTLVTELSPANETTPEVSYDGLTIFVSSDAAGTQGSQDIWMATRASRGDAWSALTVVTELNSAAQETSSVMTPDGRVIVMTSQRGPSGTSDIWTSVRASPSDPWSPPVEQTALTSPSHEGSPFITADGLTIYFDSDRTGNNDLYTSTRNSITEQFPSPVPLADINTAASEEDAWLSADGRHLFFFSDRDGMPGLWETSR